MSNAFQVVILHLVKEILAFHEKALKNVFFIYLTHRKQTKGSEEEWKRKYIHFTTSSSFAIIMLIANGLAFISPIPMPASVIGMVLLFIGLCTKVVKLEQVEGLGNSLSTVITFLFVPSGISLVNSLDYATIWRSNCFVILVATLALLATTGWTGAFYCI